MPKFPVSPEHAQLGKDPEIFTVEIEIQDGLPIKGILPALNKESAGALLDIFRFAMKPKVRGYILAKQTGEVVLAVPASGYVEGMSQATTLRGEAPEVKRPKTKLSEWDRTKYKAEKAMADSVKFNVEIIIDGVVEKAPVSAVNKESMISLLTHATCDRFPRIAGWNLFDDAGTLVASVPAIQFLGELSEKTGLGKKPADPKAAGWRAVPAITPTTQDFEKMVEKAKKEGRIPEGK